MAIIDEWLLARNLYIDNATDGNIVVKLDGSQIELLARHHRNVVLYFGIHHLRVVDSNQTVVYDRPIEINIDGGWLVFDLCGANLYKYEEAAYVGAGR
jgi:hypothetical protein